MTSLWKFTPLIAAFALSACFSATDLVPSRSKSKHINDKVKFSEKAYGVAASPRVSRGKKVRKGGGRRQVGKPYKIKGKWYTPKEDHGYNKSGQASWYGPNFHGRLTANGEVYDQYALSAAHPTFPLPSYARVTNLANGKSTVVRVNDRGPYHPGRIIDLSARASKLLGYQKKGIANVQVRYVGRAPMHGLDEKYLAATYRQYNGKGRGIAARTPRNNGMRPSAGIGVGKLDSMSTGSVKKAAQKPVLTGNDPFLDELTKINNKIDTGTTLAKRFKIKQ